MDKIIIAKLDPSRWQEYKELRLRALLYDADAFGSTYDEEVQRPDNYWLERLTQADKEEKSIILFAFNNSISSSPVGMVVGYWEDRLLTGHIVYIVGMYIAPEVREKGVGSDLLNNLKKEIVKKRKFKKMRLSVNSTNLPAIKLYQKVGFETVGKFKKEIFKDGKYIDDDVMELYLD